VPTSPPVSIATQITGPATSAWANTVKHITDALNNPAAFIAYQASTVTSVPTSTWSPVGFADSAGIVLDNQSGHSTTTNNSRWTCPAGWAGWYWAQGTFSWSNLSTGFRQVELRVNGSSVNGVFGGWPAPPATGTFTQVVAFRMFLNAGDYLELYAQQSSGASMPTYIALPVTSSLSLEYRGAG
jgi:hypothetical protein